MEYMLRCEIPDETGSLARLTQQISKFDGDIHAIEIQSSENRIATDDIWVDIHSESALIQAFDALPNYNLLYIGPSRGLPSDATTRLASGLDALLSGAMPIFDAIPTIVGGQTNARRASMQAKRDPNPQVNRKILRIPVLEGELILERDYRFLNAEASKARSLVDVCVRAAAVRERAGNGPTKANVFERPIDETVGERW